MVESLKHYFGKVEDCEPLALSTLLDPGGFATVLFTYTCFKNVKFDLHDENDKDPEDLKKCRDMERLHINRWLQSDGFPEDSQLPVNAAQTE